MKKAISKRKIVFLGLVAALGVALYVNWYYTKPVQEIQQNIQAQTTADAALGQAQYVNAQASDGYFAEAELNRSKALDETKSTLQAIVDDANADAESRSEASEQLQALADNIKKQSEIENLVSAKTGGKALVTIGDTVEVILEAGTLNETTATQVKEVVLNKTDVRADQIMIVEAKTENA